MSDSRREFDRKTDQMFDLAERQLVAIGKHFVLHLAADIIDRTPGFGNQYPEDTEYIPTGRLRGGWTYDTIRIEMADRWEGGPYSDYGAEPYADIREKVMTEPLHSISYLNNDVAYGHIVRWGMGRHTIVRDWPGETADHQAEFAQRAMSEVMRGEAA